MLLRRTFFFGYWGVPKGLEIYILGKVSFISLMFSEDFNFVSNFFLIIFISLIFHKYFNVVISINAVSITDGK